MLIARRSFQCWRHMVCGMSPQSNNLGYYNDQRGGEL
ncbi:unnamed protein product [Spirodela intermedia]|uniref:Uncharacterized protein n=1 Tax=Spirodela intermedia TaxID=51605 RepID=A0A7I8K9B7_SPIIN|nr:unnamed protein product [Spirodela intermedia]